MELVNRTDPTARPPVTLAICTPTLGVVRYEWTMAREGLLLPPSVNRITLGAIDTQKRGPGTTWTELIETALSFEHKVLGRVEWIFCLEDDVIVPGDGLVNLYYAAHEHQQRVVAGWYRGKNAPHVPVVLESRDAGGLVLPKPATVLERVFCAGLGCVLLHRSVFDRLPKPWFDDAEVEVDGVSVTNSGDVFFASRLQQAGIPVYLHWGVACTHACLDGTMVRPEDGSHATRLSECAGAPAAVPADTPTA